MMDRRAFIGTLAGGLLAAPLAAAAQHLSKVPHIGYLVTHPEWAAYFPASMRNLGYVEGTNLLVERRVSDNLSPDHLRTVAQKLVALGVDLIFVDSTPAALAAKSATERLPVVFAALADPVGTGLVASLSRPGGNVTGTTIMTRDVMAKRVQLLKEAASAVSTVAIFWNPTHPHGPVQIKDAEAAVAQLRLKAQRVPVRRAEEVDSAFDMVGKRGFGLLITDDTLLVNQSERLAALASERGLPAISGGLGAFVERGGLMAYGPSLVEQFQGAAVFVDKILKGAKPGDLPIEQPTKFELVINLKTAKALGLTIPPSLLQRADQVIE
jgi:putative tryptophan/tyrosine transport system substrate-binding protein